MWEQDVNGNISAIRRQVEDYYGTAMFSGMPMAMMDLERVRRMSDSEILREARRLGLL